MRGAVAAINCGSSECPARSSRAVSLQRSISVVAIAIVLIVAVLISDTPVTDIWGTEIDVRRSPRDSQPGSVARADVLGEQQA